MGIFGKRWKVVIEEKGPSGTVRYQEGKNEAGFYWEFSGGDSVVFMSGTKQADWDAAYSWAAGRCAEVFQRVADEVISKKARSCKSKINLPAGTINIYK